MKLNIKILLTICFTGSLLTSYAQDSNKTNDSIVLEKGKFVDGVTIEDLKSQKNNVVIDNPIITKPPLFKKCKTLTDIEKQKKCFMQTMQKFISLKFDSSALKVLPIGKHKIYCFFTISKEGEITNIETYSKYKIAEEEALRSLLEIPKLEPGEINGKPADIVQYLPITFKLQ